MRTALVGYSGFVGGNIASQTIFDHTYNRTNIQEVEGKEYDLVVSAANRADMWRINQEGEADLADIKEYIGHISKAKIHKLVLISTVGVYKNPNGADEDTPIETEGLTPYGKNRYYLERWCRENFDTTIIRLPGLFGKGLKKNVIYDLLHNNMVENIHKDGVYQYYDLNNIWKDIQVALDNNLPLVNLAVPPISTKEVAQYVFNIEFTNAPADIKPAFWDMHSKYAALYGGEGNYLYSQRQELDALRDFVAAEKASS